MRTTLIQFTLALALGIASHASTLKVYILSGQSNMQGHAAVTTFDYMATDPKTAPLLKKMRDSSGEPVVLNRTWISYLSEDRNGDPTVKEGKLTAGFGARADTIGPEFTFGITMEEATKEPILIIKTAWGGKSLHTDFRPPSATDKAAGEYYKKMIDYVKTVLVDPKKVIPDFRPGTKVELAGFVWFQGWNDMTDGGKYPQRGKPGGYDRYSEYLAHLIRDVRKDLNAPNLPFVVGVLGVNGPTKDYSSPRYVPIHQGFRDAMAAPAKMPEFQGNVVNVLTEEFWDHRLAEVRSKKERTPEEEEIAKGFSNQEFHYLGAAKIHGPIGEAFAKAMLGMR